MSAAESLAWCVVVLNLVGGASTLTFQLRPLSWRWLEPVAIYSFAIQNFVAVAAIVALAIE